MYVCCGTTIDLLEITSQACFIRVLLYFCHPAVYCCSLNPYVKVPPRYMNNKQLTGTAVPGTTLQAHQQLVLLSACFLALVSHVNPSYHTYSSMMFVCCRPVYVGLLLCSRDRRQWVVDSSRRPTAPNCTRIIFFRREKIDN